MTESAASSRLRRVDVGRALLEGGAVLLGILVAFGIDAWWGVRVEREQTRAYQEALVEEARQNRALLDYALENDPRFDVAGLADYFTSVIYARGPVADSVIETMVWELAPQGILHLGRAALSDLLSSGGLAGIDDGRVRRAVTAYDQAVEIELEAQRQVERVWWNQVVPYLSAHVSLDDLYPRDFIEGYLETPQMLEGRFPPDTEAFVGSRDWATRFTYLISEYRTLRQEREDLRAVVNELIEGLEASLGG